MIYKNRVLSVEAVAGPPVSYTHLDVYKRQALNKASLVAKMPARDYVRPDPLRWQ